MNRPRECACAHNTCIHTALLETILHDRDREPDANRSLSSIFHSTSLRYQHALSHPGCHLFSTIRPHVACWLLKLVYTLWGNLPAPVAIISIFIDTTTSRKSGCWPALLENQFFQIKPWRMQVVSWEKLSMLQTGCSGECPKSHNFLKY